MKAILTILVMLAAIPAAADPAAQPPGPKTSAVCLADVTVTARPTGKRHQSYVFTLKSKKDDSSWTLELYQDFGGGLLLYVAGSRLSVDEEKDLHSRHQQSTVVTLQEIEPLKALTGQMITHKLVSLTWRQREPNQVPEDTARKLADPQH